MVKEREESIQTAATATVTDVTTKVSLAFQKLTEMLNEPCLELEDIEALNYDGLVMLKAVVINSGKAEKENKELAVATNSAVASGAGQKPKLKY